MTVIPEDVRAARTLPSQDPAAVKPLPATQTRPPAGAPPSTATTTPPSRPRRPWRTTAWELVAEVALVAVLFGIYQVARHFADGQANQAMRHAAWLWDLERALHMPDEATLQAWALDWTPTARMANIYYVGMHFPGTAAVMLWTWFRDRAGYRRFRTELAVLTASGLVLHVLFPLAPPRLMHQFGLVDTMLTVGPSAYPDTPGGIANQFAAMPSLHVGWALLAAVAVVRSLDSRWRWLALLHPALTVTVVVVTANHYWLDGVVGAALVGAAIAVVSGLSLTSGVARYIEATPGVPPR